MQAVLVCSIPIFDTPIAGGEILETTTKTTTGAGGMISTEKTIQPYGFEQGLNNNDQNSVSATSTNIIVGAKEKKVYFYNSSGTVATMSFGDFKNLGRKKK